MLVIAFIHYAELLRAQNNLTGSKILIYEKATDKKIIMIIID